MTVQEQIQQLESALAQGISSVQVGDRVIRYRDLAEVQQILSSLKQSQNNSQGQIRVLYPSYSKGL
jgi:hypothetical protein